MGKNTGFDWMRYLPRSRENWFRNLRRDEYCVTSEPTSDYNCIAYAAGKQDVNWWPLEELTTGWDWPEEAPREETVEAFIMAYRTLGYEPCDSGDYEEGFEKVVIYTKSDGTPTHAARQITDGTGWASKLGGWEDIRHKTVEGMEGRNEVLEGYGKACQYLKRKARETFVPKYIPCIS